MVQLLKYFFLALGVVFFAILLFAAYFSYTSGISPRAIFSNPAALITDTPASGDAHPYLSASQEASLRAVGVNPASLPTSLTDAQKACLLTAVGEARAKEIIGGSSPTMTELFKAKSCI